MSCATKTADKVLEYFLICIFWVILWDLMGFDGDATDFMRFYEGAMGYSRIDDWCV